MLAVFSTVMSAIFDLSLKGFPLLNQTPPVYDISLNFEDFLHCYGYDFAVSEQKLIINFINSWSGGQDLWKISSLYALFKYRQIPTK